MKDNLKAPNYHTKNVFIDISLKTLLVNEERDIENYEETIDYIGKIQIKLYWNDCPITCENFFRLIEGSFYSSDKSLPNHR